MQIYEIKFPEFIIFRFDENDSGLVCLICKSSDQAIIFNISILRLFFNLNLSDLNFRNNI